MNRKGKNFLMAIIFSVIVIVVAVAGYMVLGGDNTLGRIFQILGGFMPSGVIQFMTYVAFFWGIFEINERSHKIKYERKSFEMGLLPEKEQWVLSPDDVNDLKIKMINQEESGKLLMTDIIKKASTKFRANKSISDVMDIVSTQVKINMTRAESRQSVIRYLTWAIPSIGFIGTILGIAQALGYADQASDPEGLKMVTSQMYIAFDTTLVSLILSIILVWFFYRLQENEEELHTNMEEYVMENLVNRIHVE
ncbi:MAG: MotA/TolQ/ExbB proton channel family protein [Chitinophagales bacterium]